VKLRTRLVVAFAAVAVGTAGAIALAAPLVIGQSYERLGVMGPNASAGPGGGGQGGGRGIQAGVRAETVLRDTSLTILLVAAGAAVVATGIGLAVSRSLTRPLERLEAGAAAVARREFDHRSGLADRADEFGALGRSFDAMAAELAAAEASRRRFLQDAAHELKTPLAVIEATTSAILDGVYPASSAHVGTVRAQARLLARIVDDLRTISIAEGGRLPLRRQPLDLAALLSDVATSHAARAAERGQRLLVEPTSEALTVEADPDRMRQVLGALVDNALRHAPDGGEVRLVAEHRGSRTAAGPVVRVAVSDTGPGFAGADLPRVFDRFYQADESRDRASGTSGLGLAIARALVEAHGGTIRAANRPAGGAEVSFELPA
jgi:two-component system sensor histidine kinase BaeS